MSRKADPFLPGAVGGTYNLDDDDNFPECQVKGCINRGDCIIGGYVRCNQHRNVPSKQENFDLLDDDTARAAVAVAFQIPIDAVTLQRASVFDIPNVPNPQGIYVVASNPRSADGRSYQYGAPGSAFTKIFSTLEQPRQDDPAEFISPALSSAAKFLFGAASPSSQTVVERRSPAPFTRSLFSTQGVREQLRDAAVAQSISNATGAPPQQVLATIQSLGLGPSGTAPSSTSPRVSPKQSPRLVVSPKQQIDRTIKLMEARSAVAASETVTRLAEKIAQRITVDQTDLTNAAARAATDAATSAVNQVGRELIVAVNQTAQAAQASASAAVDAIGRVVQQGNPTPQGLTSDAVMQAIDRAATLAAARAADNLAGLFQSRVQIDAAQIQQILTGSEQFAQAAAQSALSSAEILKRVQDMREVQLQNDQARARDLLEITGRQGAIFTQIGRLSDSAGVANDIARATLQAVENQTEMLGTLTDRLPTAFDIGQQVARNIEIPTAAQIGTAVGANLAIPTAAQIAAAIPQPPVPASADAIGVAVANRMVQLGMRPPSAGEIVQTMDRAGMRPPTADEIGRALGIQLRNVGAGGAPGPGGPPGGAPGPGRGPGAPGPGRGPGAPGPGGPPGGGGPPGAGPMQGIIMNPNNPNPIQVPTLVPGVMDIEAGPMTQQFIAEFSQRLADMSEQQRRSYKNFMDSINKQISDIVRKRRRFDPELIQTIYDSVLNQYGFVMGEGYIANVIDIVRQEHNRYEAAMQAGGLGMVDAVAKYLYPLNMPVKPVDRPGRTPSNAVPGTNGSIIFDPMDIDGQFIEGAGIYGNIKNPTIPPVTVSFDKKALTDKYICTQRYQNKLRSKKFRSMFDARLFAMRGGFYSDEVAKTRQASYQRPQNALRVIPNITR